MKFSICKHCKKEFEISEKPNGWMANHSRWCKENPKKKDYVKSASERISGMNHSRTGINSTNQWIKAKSLNLEISMSDETKKKISNSNKGRKHSSESRDKIRKAARNSNHRRLRKNPILYKGIILDSTWEFELAKRLDSINVVWIRPEPIRWKDKQGIEHNYFPDFFLPKYNIYLDPKNPHVFNQQKEKIEIISSMINIIWIDSIEKCKTINKEEFES
jgi:hypothetical protein